MEDIALKLLKLIVKTRMNEADIALQSGDLYEASRNLDEIGDAFRITGEKDLVTIGHRIRKAVEYGGVRRICAELLPEMKQRFSDNISAT